MSDEVPFGHALREKRTELKISLRKLAQQTGVSPTYLSQVEQCNVLPPTVDRIKRIAELLGENADKWITMSGRVPDDLAEIIRKHPVELPRLIRLLSAWSPNEVSELVERVSHQSSGDV